MATVNDSQLSRDQLLDRLRVLERAERERMRLLHELEVHQQELVQQNEALRVAQAALEDSRQRYQDLFDFAPVGYLVMNADSGIVEANLAAAGMLGQERECLIGSPLARFLPPGTLDSLWRLQRQVGQAITVLHTEIEVRDSAERGPRFLRVECQASRNRQGINGHWRLVLVDTTAQWATTQALRASEERYRSLVDTAPDAIFVNSGDRLVLVNQACLRLFGAERPEQLLGKSLFELFHPAFHAVIRERIQRMLERGEPVPLIEEKIIRLDGEPVEVEVAAAPFAGAGVRGIHVMLRDISERKRVQRELHEREVLLHTITENSPDPIFMKDRECRLLFANPATLKAIRQSGTNPRSLADILGKTDAEFLGDPAIGRAIMANDRRIMASGCKEVVEETVTGLGGTRIYLSHKTPYRDAAGRVVGLIGIGRDITEQKRGETERIARMERQRDTLIREVHHRIKNHLQGVIGLLRSRITAHPECAGQLKDVIGQIRAIAHIYGLQSHSATGGVRLDQLLETLIHSGGGPLPVQQYTPPDPGAATGALLVREEAVSLALVLNELLTNAGKHTLPSEPVRPLRVGLTAGAGEWRVTIRNGPATLPDGFDFATGCGLGTGLELLSALLPLEGATLTVRQVADEVLAELRLTTPIILPTVATGGQEGSEPG